MGRRVEPQAGEVDRAVGRPEALAAAAVVEVVEAEVEAGARADLEQPQRQAVALRELEEAEGERRAAADLVRLARLRHERLQALALFVYQAVKGGPGAVDAGAAAGGRVVGGKARGLSRQHQPVDGGHQPQREGVGAQVGRVEGLDEPEDRPARPASSAARSSRCA